VFILKEYVMTATNKPLLTLTTADLMIRDVIVIPLRTTTLKAAHLLAKAQISGAPVVDAEGRCIGLISVADIFRGALNENLEMEPEDCVGEHMTTNLVTADSTTPIRQLTQMMLGADGHLVIVVDDQRRPIGIVSSTDVLAAIASAGIVK